MPDIDTSVVLTLSGGRTRRGGGRSAPHAVLAAVLAVLGSPAARGQDYMAEPISYGAAETRDPVARLQERIDRGDVALERDPTHGYLPAVLRELDVPVSSQVLVFSKTSFQLKRISPRSPRAIYFNDAVSVGWVRGGDVVELASVDPEKGAVFYTLDQRPQEVPKFVRHTYECTSCHASTLTDGVPGQVVRSVFPSPDGTPILSAGTFVTDHASPMAERWGGWYVTGSHGGGPHMGNVVFKEGDPPEALGTLPALEIPDLRDRVDVSAYLAPQSDVVALMVLEHQCRMLNLLTRAGYEARWALREQEVLDGLLGRPSDELSPSIRGRIDRSAESLLRYMLLADEAPLVGPIRGTSEFAREFARRGPRDHRGRSLRDLDLDRRLFKYPCSYLIHSESFASLPAVLRETVLCRLHEVLTAEDTRVDFPRLTREERRAVLEILRDTLDGLPEAWRREEAAAGRPTADI